MLLILAGAALLLLAAASVALVMGFRPDPPAPPPEIRNLDTLVRAYLQVHGGLENISSKVSMRSKGLIYYPGDESPVRFTIVKRRPDLFWARFDTGEFVVTEAFDGSEAWRRTRNLKTGRSQIRTLTGAEKEEVMRHAEFDSVFVREFENYDQLRFNGNRSYREADYFEVAVDTGNLNVERTILINQDTFADEFHIEHLVSEGNTFMIRQEKFRKVQDVNLPFLITREKDGEMQWRMEIDQIQLNVGVTTRFFERPVD